MDRNYYTYQEILLALREEYVKNQILLDKLSTYIKINGNGKRVGDINLEANLISKNERYALSRIRLIIRERQNLLKRIFNELKYCISCYNWNGEFSDKVCFEIKENKKSGYHFAREKNEYVPFNEGFNPFVSITRQNDFDSIINEILNSKIMSLTSKCLLINSLQKLTIDGSGISLRTDTDNFGIFNSDAFSLGLVYDSRRDILRFNCESDNWYYILTELLKTEIPSYKIPNSYKLIIDSSISATKLIRVDERECDGSNLEFMFEEYPNKIVLKRVKKKGVI